MDSRDTHYTKYDAIARFTTQRLIRQIVIAVFGYFLLVTTHIGWGPVLFEHSLTKIPLMQQDINQNGRNFFGMYSNFGSGDSQVYMIFFLFLFAPDNIDTLFFSLMFPMEVLIILLFKSVMQNPRPFWATDEIKPDHCSDAFGNPSGHSFCASYFMTYLFFRYWWRWAFGKQRQRDWEDFEVQTKLNGKQKAILIGSACFMAGLHIVMELSRMYLGMHAANQVILGASMGTWTALVAVFILLPYFEAYVAHLKQTSDVSSMVRLNRMVLLAMLALGVFVISLTAILDKTVFQTYKIPAEYAANLAACKGKPSYSYHASPFTMLLTSYSLYPLGVFLGLQFRWQFKRGWSNPWVDNHSTTKYVILKWTVKFFAGVLTLAIPFLYAVFFALIVGKTSILFGLFFNWIPIVMLNGFLIACGFHTFVSRAIMSKCGYPDTFDINYLSTSSPYSIVQTENSSVVVGIQ